MSVWTSWRRAARRDTTGEAQARTMTFRVRRCDPERDRKPRWASYRVQVWPKMSVLDALFAILQRSVDPRGVSRGSKHRTTTTARGRAANLGPTVAPISEGN